MKKLILGKTLVFLFVSLFFYSCIEENYDFDNLSEDIVLKDMALALPVGQINNVLEDYVNWIDSGELESENGIIYFSYKDYFTLEMMNIPEIIPFTSVENFDSAISTEFEKNVSYELAINSVSSRLDSVKLTDTQIMLEIEVNNSLLESALFELVLPEGVFLENPADAVFQLSTGTNTKVFDVKDESVLRVKQTPSPHISLIYKIRTENAISLSSNDVNVSFQFSAFTPEVIWGYFAELAPTVKNKNIDIDFFTDILPENAKFYFHNPIFSCRAHNFVGIPASFLVSDVKAADELGNEVYAVFDNNPTDRFEFVLNTPSEAYEYAETQRDFDRENGGTQQLFQIEPTVFSYKFKFTPIVNEGDHHFIVKDKYVDVLVDVKLPLHFDEESFLSTNDTLDLDLTGEDFGDLLKEAVVRINYTKLLATKDVIDISFLNESDEVIPNLSQSFAIKASPTDNLGNPTKEIKDALYIKLKDTDLDDATQVKKMVLKLHVAGDGADKKVNIRSADYLKFKVDLFVKGDIK